MKVLVAIDSFKGSLSSMEAGNTVKEGILKACPHADIIVKPLADGGEGTAEAFVEGLGGKWFSLEVCGPYGERVVAKYAYVAEKKLAIIEMAEASGITLSKRKEPMKTTTFGVGELIMDAIKRGAQSFIIGIGGSATNDAGMGMLQALGYQFLNQEKQILEGYTENLKEVCYIDDTEVTLDFEKYHFQIACDVNNPLCGENGATYIYGPQKGVTEDNKVELDSYLSNFADITQAYIGEDKRDFAGTGAAGGLGFAFLAYLKAEMKSGIDLILEALELPKYMANIDYLVTGEGRLDQQTAMGKGPVGIARMGKEAGASTIAFAGSILEGAALCNENGIDAYFCVLQGISTLEEAMQKEVAKKNIVNTVEQVFRLLENTKINDIYCMRKVEI